MDQDVFDIDIDGKTVKCQFQCRFNISGIEYVAFIDSGTSDDVFIFRYRECKDEFILEDIIDDDEFDAVSREYYRIMKD